MILRRILISLTVVMLAAACGRPVRTAPTSVPQIVNTFAHDAAAFTQGLTIHDGWLYEGTGGYGRSSIRRVALASGRVEHLATVDRRYFGEGITVLDDRLYQLTWREGLGFVYDLPSFQRVATFRYAGEGWGLTSDGDHLIVSDGTDALRYFDPADFKLVRGVNVTDGGTPVVRLNELEYINGEIWANVWGEDRIARIDPVSGTVIAWFDLSDLYPRDERGLEDVLNGIAWDAATNRVFVTGKHWPQLFELRVAP
jgi:glutamine cyclotransferase